MSSSKEQQQRLERHAGATAQAHWRRLLRRIRAGEDVAAECEAQVLADGDAERTELARQIYNEAAVGLLAALDEPALQSLMSPWLEDAVAFALGDWEPVDGPESGDKNPERGFIERLVRGQYVLTVQDQARRSDGGPSVYGFPGERASLSSLCELCATETSGTCTLRLYKATGAPFTEAEAESAFRAMRTAFLTSAEESGRAEPWEFEWANEGEDDRVIVVEIHNHFAEEQDDEDDSVVDILDETPSGGPPVE